MSSIGLDSRYHQDWCLILFYREAPVHKANKGIGDAGSTADLRMLWSAIVCLGLL